MAIEHKDIAAIRADYSKGSLDESDVLPNPFAQFERWFAQALEAHVVEPNAMVVSTINRTGFPSSRVVLLKDIKKDGLSFFTNYHSQKGHDIAANNKISILFFWPELQRQVRMEGYAEQLPSEDSDEYFASRPRGSQIGAWSSPQSEEIDNRDYLEDSVRRTEARFEGQEVPRPQYWGGFFVRPIRFEYWQGRSSRLHDRISYTLEPDSTWQINRLAP